MSEMKENIYKGAGWLLIIAIIYTGYFISQYEDYSSLFLTILIAEIILVIFFCKRFSNAQITISRIILGLLFVYSGFVKGVDPLGTQYRIIDYFIAFDTDWAEFLALPLSIILNASEFILGVLLLFNVRMKITSWLVVLMMAIFTVVTINDALYSPVPDCGCFGDAIILSNWQTFYKNLVINALLLIVFLSRNRIASWFKVKIEWAILIVSVFGFVFFEIYNIRHLPVIDFRDWKVGNMMVNEKPLPLEYYLTYRNSNTGEEKEYTSPDYPYNDSVWLSQWEFVKQRVVDPNPRIHDLRIEDETGNDYTAQFIENPDYQLLFVLYDISGSKSKQNDLIRDFSAKCNDQGISFIAITSSLPEEVRKYKMENNFDIEFYYADDITLMAMVRSNPGLVLLKDGVVLDKWHINDFPSYGEFETEYLLK